MQIASDFEGGRIEVKASNPRAEVVLRVPADGEAPKFRQWFAFDARGEAGKLRRFRIENAGECTWGDAFGGLYRVYASYDDETWFRIPTKFDGKALHFSHKPDRARVRYAYHPPFSSARLARMLVEVSALGLGTCRALAKTERGGQIHLIEIGNTAEIDGRHLWIIAQQHPGEPMAGWFMEGLVERLLSGDEQSRALMATTRLHLVPRMNPDGCALGNHRTNAAGVDLNRQWEAPSPRAIEVRCVREAMLKTGASFFLDVHGDERLPYVFGQLPDLHPARPAGLPPLEKRFETTFAQHDSSYQTEHKYPFGAREKPLLAIAANWAQNTFSCLALTLEMPFSDDKNAPREEGWSPDRSKRLGGALVDTLLGLAPDLPPSRPVAEALGSAADGATTAKASAPTK